MSRQPGSLPDPSKPAGTVNDAMPSDHIVVVMMENHSFAPKLTPPGVPGGYDLYGRRVPAVVASPYPKPTASPTLSTITPRSWRRSRLNGTCRRSPIATPTRPP